jgi:hypothetical protein
LLFPNINFFQLKNLLNGRMMDNTRRILLESSIMACARIGIYTIFDELAGEDNGQAPMHYNIQRALENFEQIRREMWQVDLRATAICSIIRSIGW